MDLPFNFHKKIISILKNNYDFINNDDLLAKYLAGETSMEENNEIEIWLKADPANTKYFEGIMQIWNNVNSLKNNEFFDTKTAWKKNQSRINSNQPILKTINSSTKRPFLVWKIAASILVFIGISYSIFTIYINQREITITTFEGKRKIELPDGSSVFLNKNTIIIYKVNMSESRKVKISGEAFFDVVADKQHPFLIEANGLEVKVLGTKFNVNAYSDSEFSDIIVESGKVEVRNALDTILLLPGEKAEVEKRKGKLKKLINDDINYLAYQTNIYVFKNARLGKAIDDLEQNFGKKINLSDTILQNCTITATFKNNSLKEIMAVLKETLNLKVEEKDGEFSIEGNGCK